MKRTHVGLVLLSGGMDSTLLLHHALYRYRPVEALHLSYGQPSGVVELERCRALCARLGVPLHVATVIGAVFGVPGTAPPPGHVRGISNANMPARNMVFLSVATSLVGERWGDPVAARRDEGPRVHILMGPVFEDVGLFPDCTRAFQKAADATAREALRNIVAVSVRFPFWRWPKADMLRLFARKWPAAVDDVRQLSMSCYAGNDCGACDACRVRAAAFARAGMEDR